MKVLTCDKVLGWPTRANNLYLALQYTIEILQLSITASKRAKKANIEFVWQLIEKSEVEYLNEEIFTKKDLSEIKESLGKDGPKLGVQLSWELKIALGIPTNGTEPRERAIPSEALPTVKELNERINRLIWLRDNYDAVKAGLKAFDSP
ncbi:MAG: DNA-directed RNA polymerase subunit alpha C-terminal domain-containing protein [Patescibacteria group bacterium]|jgi:DNA-directed RNA polymerase subunit alpha